jgi:hypothetical protein
MSQEQELKWSDVPSETSVSDGWETVGANGKVDEGELFFVFQSMYLYFPMKYQAAIRGEQEVRKYVLRKQMKFWHAFSPVYKEVIFGIKNNTRKPAADVYLQKVESCVPARVLKKYV